MAYPRIPLAERLARGLQITKNGCLEWTGARTWNGYGRIAISHTKMARAHRVAWELANGPIPAGAVVRHVICDNPPCCNVAHLALGTESENVDDCIRKGRRRPATGDANGSRKHPERQPRGERHGMVRLTEALVRAIRRDYIPGYGSQAELGRQYGVHPETIRAIVTRKSWRHLDTE